MGQPVIHFEIGCKDKDKTRQFYTELFDWKTQDFQQATMIDTGTKEGIHGHISALGHEPHQYVTFYVQVDDIPQYLQRIEKLGGKTVVPPQDVPEAGQFAWFSDPEGNVIGLWKPVQA